jgi:hypothetical protein
LTTGAPLSTVRAAVGSVIGTTRRSIERRLIVSHLGISEFLGRATAR